MVVSVLTNKKKFDYIIFIGRMQLFHNSHLFIIKKALAVSENVIVVLGSAFKPRTPKNPWSIAERKEMILPSLTQEEQKRVHFTWARDYLYSNPLWIKEVKQNVGAIINKSNAKVGLIGHKKDETSFYLDFFSPEWEDFFVENIDGINATTFRNTYWEQGLLYQHHDHIPLHTLSFLNKFIHTAHYLYIRDWYNEVKKIKARWDAAPHEPHFVTTDAVVFQSNHVLMVRRKAQPGKGLLALPGGYLNTKETLLESMLRELKEETKIKLPTPVLDRKLHERIKDSHVFDHPERSDRGRIVTHAYMIQLDPSKTLPKVKGSDDAEKAVWISLDKLETEEIFEDHFDIIKYFEARA